MQAILERPAVVSEPAPRGCCCGNGWCPICGTDHLTEEQEELERNLRIDNQSRSGVRVIRKQLRGDE